MAQQIQDLVASIRKDGIAVAQKEAKEVLATAQAEADEIVAKAKREAESLLAGSKREIDTHEKSVRASLQQASRDVQIALKAAIIEQLDRLLVDAVDTALQPKELLSLIVAVVAAAGESKTKVIELNEATAKALAESLPAALTKEMKAGLEIKPSKRVASGFRLVEKDGSFFFDFSNEEIASLLKPYLSPAIQEMIFA